MKPKLFDTIRLTKGCPNDGLSHEALGVIITIFEEPDEAYEVEFVDDDGTTIAQLALQRSQFVLV